MRTRLNDSRSGIIQASFVASNQVLWTRFTAHIEPAPAKYRSYGWKYRSISVTTSVVDGHIELSRCVRLPTARLRMSPALLGMTRPASQ